MDMQLLVDLISENGRLQRRVGGQFTLGQLREALGAFPPDMPVRFDTGEKFGSEPVTYRFRDPFSSEYYSHDGYWDANSKTAYPSCYRGYYSDCTFNAYPSYEIGPISHLIDMINATIGKSFNGYKGGINLFDEDTLVWGGDTSYSDCGKMQVVGVEEQDGVCIIVTKPEEEEEE